MADNLTDDARADSSNEDECCCDTPDIGADHQLIDSITGSRHCAHCGRWYWADGSLQ